MIETIAAIINLLSALGIGFLVLHFYLKYLKVKKFCKKMDPEDLLNEIIPDYQAGRADRAGRTDQEDHQDEKQTKRERLLSLVSGGKSKQYLGREFQVSDLEKMTPEQIDKLYCRYEARLGSIMTKTLGNSFINLYVFGVSKYFKVVDPPKLIEDLEEDPFIDHALTSACCELYYKYGMFLAPFTAVLTTLKHIDFSKEIKYEIENDGDYRDFEIAEE